MSADRLRFLLFLVALSALAAGCAGASPETAPPPNVVLIISDDHGWSDHGFMGHPDVRTPHLDRLAAESMTYTRGYVPSAVCRPSLATMATGLYPHRHGITGNDPPGGRAAIRDSASRASMVEIFARHVTLPERLAGRGYVSHQSGKWWEGDPLDHGFTAAMTHGVVARGGRHGDEGLTIGREGMRPVFDFIDAAGEQPFFLWYAPFLPHTPHNPPDSLLAAFETPGRAPEVARYYAMIAWFDETVGQLLDHIDARGLRENTLVLYVVDNGWVQPVAPQRMADSRAKMSPYDAGMRTPILMRWPGVVEPGRDERTLVGSIDLAPTILRAAGLEPDPEMPGIDLRDRDLLADRDRLFGALFAHTAVDVHRPEANLKYRTIVREDGWKLILPYMPNRDVPLMIDGRTSDWMRFEPELYQVLDDPYERNDRAAERPGLVDSLRAELDAWWSPGS